MRDLNYDLKRLQAAHDDGSHGTRTARSYALAQIADTLHDLGFKGLRATGLKLKHVDVEGWIVLENDKSRQRLRQIIEKGAQVTGATTGAILACALETAWIGIGTTAIASTGVYQRIGAEVANRLLSPREETRIGRVLKESAEFLVRRLEDDGASLRDDGFFDDPVNGDRPDAEQILEGVIRKAQGEYEERKLPYLSRLWANACIDESLGVGRINRLLKLADQLTYRQLVILSLVGEVSRTDENVYNLRTHHYKEEPDFDFLGETAMVLAELQALRGLECVGMTLTTSVTGVIPSRVSIAVLGAVLHNTLELEAIPRGDRDHVIELLT